MEDSAKSIWEMSASEVGKRGEDLAVVVMEKAGMEILERNWRDPSAAEADIIARDDKTIVFIEVKTRRNDHFGAPEEAITEKKQKQYRKLAKQYSKQYEGECNFVRFDSVSVLLEEDNHAILRHIRNAVQADE